MGTDGVTLRRAHASGSAFTTTGFSSSSALKLHSDNSVGRVANQLNIYDNISRRGGGIGADGTL